LLFPIRSLDNAASQDDFVSPKKVCYYVYEMYFIKMGRII